MKAGRKREQFPYPLTAKGNTLWGVNLPGDSMVVTKQTIERSQTFNA